MKTAISISDELFAAADRVADQLGISRSELYALAVERLVAEYGQDPVTAKLDELAEHFEPAVDVDAGRKLIEDGQWEW